MKIRYDFAIIMFNIIILYSFYNKHKLKELVLFRKVVSIGMNFSLLNRFYFQFNVTQLKLMLYVSNLNSCILNADFFS